MPTGTRGRTLRRWPCPPSCRPRGEREPGPIAGLVPGLTRAVAGLTEAVVVRAQAVVVRAEAGGVRAQAVLVRTLALAVRAARARCPAGPFRAGHPPGQ